MADPARVEAFVVQVGIARGWISQEQLQAAQSGPGASVLARLAPRLPEQSRNQLQAVYQQALAAEGVTPPSLSGASPSGSGPPPSGLIPAHDPRATVTVGTAPALAAPPAPGPAAARRASLRGAHGGPEAATRPGLAVDSGSGDPEFAHEDAALTLVNQTAPGPDSDFGAHPSGRTGAMASERVPGGEPPERTAPARRALAPQPSGRAPTLGERIGNYQTLSELGRGGMGIVYKARDERSGEQVALKLMIVTKKTTEDDVTRFKNEARAALKLDHPNLVRVLEQGVTDDGHWYTAMDLVAGDDLDQRIKQDGPFDADEAAAIALDLADGLAYAHEQGVLHRDIKPQNVLLDEEGAGRLTDFGLAKLQEDDVASLTASGALLGTPAYMAPEQANGTKRLVDERTDVYCLGATLYHMLTGRPPFERPSLTALLLAITAENPTPIRVLRDGVDRDLETIVFKCLEKDRDQRYQSMRALGRDLNRWLKRLDIVAKRPSAAASAGKWARENRPLVAVSVVASLAVLGALGFAFKTVRDARQLAQASPAARGETPPTTKTGEGETDETDKTSETDTKAEPASAKTDAKTEPASAKTDTETAEPAKTDDETAEPAKTAESEAVAATSKTDDETAEPAKTAEGEAVAATSKTDDEPPPRKTEDQPPPRRDPPPSRRDPPPPREGEPPPVDPKVAVATEEPVVLPASEPPAWLVRRLEHLRGSRRKLLSTGWAEALVEARARQVPIVAGIVDHDLKKLSSGLLLSGSSNVDFLNTEVVFVPAQGPHPPDHPAGVVRPGPGQGPGPGGRPRPGPGPGGRPNEGGKGGGQQGGGPQGGGQQGGGPQGRPGPLPLDSDCPVFDGIQCRLHVDATAQVGVAVPSEGATLAVIDPAGRVISVSAPRQPDAQRGEFALKSKALAAAVEQARGHLRPPALDGDALTGAGLELLAAEAKFSGRARARSFEVFEKHAEAPGPLGAWARQRLRALCEEELSGARGDADKVAALAEKYARDRGCLVLIAQAR